MFPIASTTVMKTKNSRWFNAWTTPFSEILDGSKKNDETTIDEGMCVRVMPGLNNSFYGPYLNGVIANNGEERVFLICLEQGSDYNYSTGLALKGEYIKPCKKPGTGKLFTKSFDDLVEVDAKKRLEGIAAGSVDKTPSLIPSNEVDLVDEVLTTAGADSRADLIDEVAATPTTTTGTPPSTTATPPSTTATPPSTTANGTPGTTATGTPGTTANGTPGTTATGEETVAQKEVLNLEDSDQEETLNILENLMATATQKCHDFGLPMFIGICLPPKKYKK